MRLFISVILLCYTLHEAIAGFEGGQDHSPILPRRLTDHFGREFSAPVSNANSPFADESTFVEVYEAPLVKKSEVVDEVLNKTSEIGAPSESDPETPAIPAAQQGSSQIFGDLHESFTEVSELTHFTQESTLETSDAIRGSDPETSAPPENLSAAQAQEARNDAVGGDDPDATQAPDAANDTYAGHTQSGITEEQPLTNSITGDEEFSGTPVFNEAISQLTEPGITRRVPVTLTDLDGLVTVSSEDQVLSTVVTEVDGTVTVYVTWCPITDETYATYSEPYIGDPIETTQVPVTVTDPNGEVTVTSETQFLSTVITEVDGTVTIYTTWCPLTEETQTTHPESYIGNSIETIAVPVIQAYPDDLFTETSESQFRPTVTIETDIIVSSYIIVCLVTPEPIPVISESEIIDVFTDNEDTTTSTRTITVTITEIQTPITVSDTQVFISSPLNSNYESSIYTTWYPDTDPDFPSSTTDESFSESPSKQTPSIESVQYTPETDFPEPTFNPPADVPSVTITSDVPSVISPSDVPSVISPSDVPSVASPSDVPSVTSPSDDLWSTPPTLDTDVIGSGTDLDDSTTAPSSPPNIPEVTPLPYEFPSSQLSDPFVDNSTSEQPTPTPQSTITSKLTTYVVIRSTQTVSIEVFTSDILIDNEISMSFMFPSSSVSTISTMVAAGDALFERSIVLRAVAVLALWLF
ncbi:HBR414Wp [Eremothecium sinecaudum]|uniref:HBR414Wp n=1 Tax=Eremothecium sinecaudum TaxID=45286 RepID=A0A109UVH6_9SACH|nr:HBR414Wp [Eremothecium sinecaudum]AMD19315.1 HBR414Wp [Eremothecium sinecaudum]